MNEEKIISEQFSINLRLCLTAVVAAFIPGYIVATPVIVPTVQQIQTNGEQSLVIDESWVIVADESDSDELFNANYLRDSLKKEFGLEIDVHNVTTKRAKAAKRFVIGKPATNRHLEKLVIKKGIALESSFESEAYTLDSFTHDNQPDVFVLAEQSAGVFFGIQSLLKHPNGSFQSLFVEAGDIKIEQIEIKDWPDKPIRGAFLRLVWHTGYDDLYEWIDVMARYKMNLVVFGRDISELIDLDQIYAYARRRYIEPVPQLRGVAGGQLVKENPNISEGIPVVDEPFRFKDVAGVYIAEPEIPINQTGLIANRGFEEQVDLFSIGWSFSGSRHWSWDTTVAHSGGASVKMHVPEDPPPVNPSEQLNLNSSHYIAVQGGETYTLSFWVRTENVGGDRLPLVRTTQLDANLNFPIGTNRFLTTISLRKESNGWRQYFQPLYLADETRFLAITSFMRDSGFGTVWLDDFELRRMDGALVNVLRTEATDIHISSSDGLTVFEEGTDYRVIDGDFPISSVANGIIYGLYPLNKPTQIELLPSGAIDPSSVVNIDYDFAVMPVTGAFRNPHYSVNDPWTYGRHVFPYLEEMIGTLRPVYTVYAGVSEIRGINRDSRNDGLENYELVADDLNRVYGRLKKIDPGLQIFLWDDMMNPWHSGDKEFVQSENGGGAIGATEPLNLSLPRVTDFIPRADLIQWSWWYSEDTRGKIENSPDYFEGKSFQWLASPEDELANILEWAAACRGRPGCLGMIDWAAATQDGIEPLADYSWNTNTIDN